MAKKKTKEMTDLERKEAYLKEFKEIFEGIDTNKKKVLYAHLDNIAYMKVKLENLQKEIDANGLVEMYQNGENQYGMKPSVYLKAYNDTIKNYSNLYKQIEPYIPLEKRESKFSSL